MGSNLRERGVERKRGRKEQIHRKIEVEGERRGRKKKKRIGE